MVYFSLQLMHVDFLVLPIHAPSIHIESWSGAGGKQESTAGEAVL